MKQYLKLVKINGVVVVLGIEFANKVVFVVAGSASCPIQADKSKQILLKIYM